MILSESMNRIFKIFLLLFLTVSFTSCGNVRSKRNLDNLYQRFSSTGSTYSEFNLNDTIEFSSSGGCYVSTSKTLRIFPDSGLFTFEWFDLQVDTISTFQENRVTTNNVISHILTALESTPSGGEYSTAHECFGIKIPLEQIDINRSLCEEDFNLELLYEAMETIGYLNAYSQTLKNKDE